MAYTNVFTPGALAVAVSQRRNTGHALTAQLVADGEPQLQDGSNLLVVVVADDRVVGFAHCGSGPDTAPEPEIYACYVHPECWGTGAAQVLWTEVLTGRTRDHDFGVGEVVPIVEYRSP